MGARRGGGRVTNWDTTSSRARVWAGHMVGTDGEPLASEPSAGQRAKPPEAESFFALANLRNWPICSKIYFYRTKDFVGRL